MNLSDPEVCKKKKEEKGLKFCIACLVGCSRNLFCGSFGVLLEYIK